jgi:hypothetical protein
VSKIAPINGRFENMKAFLAHIAEDDKAVGFVGMVVRKVDDGHDMVPIHFKATCEQMSFAAAMWLRICQEAAE